METDTETEAKTKKDYYDGQRFTRHNNNRYSY